MSPAPSHICHHAEVKAGERQRRVRIGMRRLAFFLPMRGCARRCVYCDQSAITGASAPSPAEVRAAVAREREPIELCYFGGSFGSLPTDAARELLDAIRSAPRGSVVTFSSYPSAFVGVRAAETFDLLAGYPIGTVEIGAPSLDPDVLRACRREGAADEALLAMSALSRAGYHVGAQMMICLPGQSVESSERDLDAIASIMPRGAAWHLRIYPCLVLRGTELERMMNAGKYGPAELEHAVRTAGRLILRARRAGLVPIRVGLHDSPSLRESVVAGPYHPAFGELAASEALALTLAASETGMRASKREISLLTGHGSRGLRRLAELTSRSQDELMHEIVFV